MADLISQLQTFNAKERFFLVGYMLGNPTFQPSVKVCGQLEQALGLPLPHELFAAMDYHLDWLYASLQITADPQPAAIYPNTQAFIKAQQEDIDFLLAYEENETCHIILIEAKGVTGWTNRQMTSKANRLRAIFGDDGKKWQNVVPHFVLMSPREPEKLVTIHWPQWMKPRDKATWIKLDVPVQLQKITRCNDQGEAAKQGKYWTAVSRKNRTS